MANEKRYCGTGRRKSAVARVILTPGKGKITVNGIDVHDYLKQPLVLTKNEENFDVTVNVSGGGYTGQTGAIRLGITRALLEYDSTTDPSSDSSFRKILKVAGFITRDSRIKERKKPGLKKARRAPQFSKR